MENPKVRKPAVAGQFYAPLGPALKQQIESLIDKNARKSDAIACMLPHAGYMYSGKVAALTVSQINIKDTVILLGPNHTGLGAAFSIMTEGAWETPLGEVEINSDLAKRILRNSKHLEGDAQAHMREHSLEVELPILQYFKPDLKIVPMIFLSDDTEALKEIGKDIAAALGEPAYKNSMLVASSDMTHYEPQKDAERKDKEAIGAILELNEDKLKDKINELNISMCGKAPVVVMLKAAKILGAKGARLIKYETSGDVTNDRRSVVGYAGIVIQ
jgi:MEMO1 family protein